MTKRMIFHFYAFRGMEDLIAYQIHMRCLERYQHVFDEAIFIICVDDVNDIELIRSVELSLLSIGYTQNVKFIVRQNTLLQETDTFYNDLVLKMGDYDGITFFGHTKGFGNEMNARINNKLTMDDMENSVFYWIAGMYYFCLEEPEEVEIQLLYHPEPMSYGAFKVKRDICTKYQWIYSGTFMWLNTQKIHRFVEQGRESIPALYNRYYSEQFCSEVIPFSDSRSYHNTYLCNPGDFYVDSKQMIEAFLLDDENEINKFYTFYDSVRGTKKED